MSSPTLTTPVPMPVPASDRFRMGARALAADLKLDAGLVAIFIASRILVVAAGIVAEYLLPRNEGLVPGAAGPILTSLTSWDGW